MEQGVHGSLYQRIPFQIRYEGKGLHELFRRCKYTSFSFDHVPRWTSKPRPTSKGPNPSEIDISHAILNLWTATGLTHEYLYPLVLLHGDVNQVIHYVTARHSISHCCGVFE